MICTKLGLKECIGCKLGLFLIKYPNCIITRTCLVDFYKDKMLSFQNTTEIKNYITKEMLYFKRTSYFNVGYFKYAANYISPKYSSFIDKILLFI